MARRKLVENSVGRHPEVEAVGIDFVETTGC